ncbi:MAG: hypothetical protein K8I27_06145 [Planctomycetes bacterium]|nr:hypothetical protein [Planctomycetota bacterium]
MNENEGSKAMTIYIVACFVLAMVALMGYKLKNDQREELSTEYLDLAGKFADISAAYAPNINDYYRKVKDGVIKPPADKKVRDNTHVLLGNIANKLGINEGTGGDDRLDVVTRRENLKYKQYWEYSVDIRLKNVTQTEWATFLSQAQHATREYAHLARINVSRVESRFERMAIVQPAVGARKNANDRSLWNVTINFVWFGPKNENPT